MGKLLWSSGNFMLIVAVHMVSVETSTKVIYTSDMFLYRLLKKLV